MSERTKPRMASPSRSGDEAKDLRTKLLGSLEPQSLNHAPSTNGGHHSHVAGMTTELDTVKSQLRESRQNVQSLQRQLSAKSKSKLSVKAKSNTLKASKLRKDVSALEKKLVISKQLVSTMKMSLKNVKFERGKLEEQLNNSVQKLAARSDELQSSEARCHEMGGKIAKMSVTSPNKDCVELEAQLTRVNEELKNKSEELKMKTDELETKTDELETKTDELKTRTGELNTTAGKLKSFEARCHQMEGEIVKDLERAALDRGKLEEQLSHANQELKSRTDELKTTAEALQSSEARCRQMEDEIAKVPEKSAGDLKLGSLEKKLAISKKVLSTMKSSLNSIKLDRAKLEEHLSRANEQFEAHTEELKTTVGKLKSSETRCHQMEGEVTKMSEKSARKSESFKLLEEQLSRVNEQFEAQTEELKTTAGNLKSSETRCHQMEGEVTKMSEKSARKSESFKLLEEQLSRVNEQFEAQTEELNTTAENLKSSESRCGQMEGEVAKLSGNLARKSESFKADRNKLEDQLFSITKDSMEELGQARQEISSSASNFEVSLAKISKKSADELKSMKNRCAELESELVRVHKERAEEQKSSKSLCLDLKAEIQLAREQVSVSAAKLKASGSELKSAREDFSRVSAESADEQAALKSRCADLEADLSGAVKTTKMRSKELKSAEIRCEELEEELSRATSESAATLDSSESRCAELEAELLLARESLEAAENPNAVSQDTTSAAESSGNPSTSDTIKLEPTFQDHTANALNTVRLQSVIEEGPRFATIKSVSSESSESASSEISELREENARLVADIIGKDVCIKRLSSISVKNSDDTDENPFSKSIRGLFTRKKANVGLSNSKLSSSSKSSADSFSHPSLAPNPPTANSKRSEEVETTTPDDSLSELETELAASRSRLQKVSDGLELKEEMISRLIAEVEDVRLANSQSLSEWTSEKEALVSQLNPVKKELAKAITEKLRLESLLKDANLKLSNRKNEKSEANSQLLKSKADADKLVEEKTDLENKLAGIEEKVSELISEKERCKAQFSDFPLHDFGDNAEETKDSTSIDSETSLAEKISHLISKFKESSAEIVSLCKRNTKLEESSMRVKSKLHKYDSRSKAKEEKHAKELGLLRDNLSKSKDVLEQSERRLTELTDERKVFKGKLAEISKALEVGKKHKKKLAKEVVSLREQISTGQKSKVKLEAKAHILESTVENLQKSEKQHARAIAKWNSEVNNANKVREQIQRTLDIMNTRTREHMHMLSVAECLMDTLHNVSVQKLRSKTRAKGTTDLEIIRLSSKGINSIIPEMRVLRKGLPIFPMSGCGHDSVRSQEAVIHDIFPAEQTNFVDSDMSDEKVSETDLFTRSLCELLSELLMSNAKVHLKLNKVISHVK
eukprot:106900_1